MEISRLARSSADLSRLLELARLTDTLLTDSDGIYDLADVNDRLLPGLKGTMSEAELHLLAERRQGAKRAAAARGALRTPLPVGYLHDQDGLTVIDPDEEVATAVAAVFASFTATGSAYGVVVRVLRTPVPAMRLWRGLGRAAALGPAQPRPGAGHPEQPWAFHAAEPENGASRAAWKHAGRGNGRRRSKPNPLSIRPEP